MAMNARAFLRCVEGGRRPPDERVPQVSERRGNGSLARAADGWGHGVSEGGKARWLTGGTGMSGRGCALAGLAGLARWVSAQLGWLPIFLF